MRRSSRQARWWIAAGVLVAGVGSWFAFQVYEAYRPMYNGWDRARFRARESLAPPRTNALAGIEWTLVDLPPAGDVPGTGEWHTRRNEARVSKEKIFLGGASSAFVVRVVDRMEPGATYTLWARGSPESTEAPDARIYLANAIRRPDSSPLLISAETSLGPWQLVPGLPHESVSAEVRYTAEADDAGRPLFAHIESSAGRPDAAVSWGAANVYAYPPLTSQRVRDARVKMIREGTFTGLRTGAVVTVFMSPVIAQILSLVFFVAMREREVLPDGAWIRLLLVMGLAVAPLQELFAWVLISDEPWQGYRGPGYWRYVWTSARALVWMPWGVAASLLVAAAVLTGPRWRRTRLLAGVLAARAAATAMFILPALVLENGSMIFSSGLPCLFLLPAAATANDLLLGRRLAAGTADDASGTVGLKAWLFAWLVTFGTQLVQAFGTYERLTPEPPDGDCFVVTAAAQGHPRFVGSRLAPDGRRVNAQLETLRELEAQLRASAPRFHAGLRAVYDRLGPIAAARISSPWRADVAYLALKPLEWLARAGRAVSRTAGISRLSIIAALVLGPSVGLAPKPADASPARNCCSARTGQNRVSATRTKSIPAMTAHKLARKKGGSWANIP